MLHPKLSIVIPVYNEQNSIDELFAQLIPVVQKHNYEVICVDDGSSDDTPLRIIEHGKKNKHIKLVTLQRNFGHQMALSCAYTHAEGDLVISMDADLQDPPQVIPQMIDAWKGGAQIVYAKRNVREVDSWFKRTTAQLFYRAINTMSDVPIPHDVGDFRLLDRQVVDFINGLSEQSRFLRGLVAWGGYPSAVVMFDRAARHSGETHYSLGKMVNLALDGVTSFSTKPLRLATLLGFWSGVIGFFGIIYAVVGRLFFAQYWVTGWAALFVGIMFLGGVQLITIGIIGEYIGKIYKEVQARPLYIVKDKYNVS